MDDDVGFSIDRRRPRYWPSSVAIAAPDAVRYIN